MDEVLRRPLTPLRLSNNRHLDFHELCEKRGLVIAQAVYIDSATGHAVTEDPNLHADLAIVALTR